MSLKHTQALRLLNARLKRERRARRHKRFSLKVGSFSQLLAKVMSEKPLTWSEPRYGVQGADGKVQIIPITRHYRASDEVVARFAHGS